MSLDREAIAATVGEVYAPMWRALAADIPGALTASVVRPDVMQQISAARVDPQVTDEETLGLLATASGLHS
jgi:hypothetical protein